MSWNTSLEKKILVSSFIPNLHLRNIYLQKLKRLIRRSFTYLDCKSFTKIYTAFVRPHLEYAQSVWSPNLQKYVNKQKNVQIRATKLVDGLGNLDYEERLKRLNLPSLAFRRFRGGLIELYKHFHYYDQDTISPSFQRRERVTRKHEYQLLQRKAKDGIRGVQSNSFYYRRIKAWNDLPAKNINSFKMQLDEHMKNKLFDLSTIIKSD